MQQCQKTKPKLQMVRVEKNGNPHSLRHDRIVYTAVFCQMFHETHQTVIVVNIHVWQDNSVGGKMLHSCCYTCLFTINICRNFGAPKCKSPTNTYSGTLKKAMFLLAICHLNFKIVKRKLRWYPQQQERIHSSVMCIGFLNFKSAKRWLFCSEASKTLQNLRLAPYSQETSRNLYLGTCHLQHSGTFWMKVGHPCFQIVEPSSSFRNLPVPPEPASGTCIWNMHFVLGKNTHNLGTCALHCWEKYAQFSLNPNSATNRQTVCQQQKTTTKPKLYLIVNKPLYPPTPDNTDGRDGPWGHLWCGLDLAGQLWLWRCRKNYFTSSDPHRDIILLHICHKLWYSLC